MKPYILADIGEGSQSKLSKGGLLNLLGIKEVQIIQWFVEPEARVEQFDRLCEVQSDKAATDVRPSTSAHLGPQLLNHTLDHL